MRGKYVLLSLLITVVLFFCLGYVENKIYGNDSMQKALVVKQGVIIEQYEKIDKSMFEEKKVPISLTNNAITKFDDIEGKYALVKLYSGDILRSQKIGNKDTANIIEVEPNMRKLAISVSSLSDSVAGQIRKNSYVDILFTNDPTSKEPNIKTQTILQKVKVLGVADSNGSLIDGINAGKISAVILSVSPDDAHLLVNKERKGKFRLIEVSETADIYETIEAK